MPEGVFQTDRAIFDNPIWKNPAKFRLFFYIYGNAIFSKEGVDIGGIHLFRGQLLKSYRKLSDDLEYLENHSLKKYSISHIKKLIDELVEEKRLKMEISRLGTVFTVLNYEQYQGFERFEKDKSAEYRTNVPLKNLQKLSEFTSVQQRTEREQPELFDTNDSMDEENTNRERIENTARTEQEQNENNNKNVEECRRKKRMYKDPSLSSNKFSDDAIEFSLASELYNLMLVNNPKVKKPNLQTWARMIDLMIRVDNRSVFEIKEVIQWSQKDSFWQANILSTKKLREKYDQLTMKMKSIKQVNQPVQKNVTEQWSAMRKAARGE